MAKVIDQYTENTGNIFDSDNIIGECSNCGQLVRKSRCGCDEICPKCNEWLDWTEEDYEDINDEFDDFFWDE